MATTMLALFVLTISAVNAVTPDITQTPDGQMTFVLNEEVASGKYVAIGISEQPQMVPSAVVACYNGLAVEYLTEATPSSKTANPVVWGAAEASFQDNVCSFKTPSRVTIRGGVRLDLTDGFFLHMARGDTAGDTIGYHIQGTTTMRCKFVQGEIKCF